ncbi:hypothetical protein NHX12_029228 [Muraenolepis orangiensis]|uniref:Pulmonary surfactant-associated protein B n=1 Tax=Muraenolepis orangiensis TaxID=630683 RepID=A0A9Q0EF92_9TELE|nr:hypothetical protein NHX12_029228 [Muraenolepis orangiensis]
MEVFGIFLVIFSASLHPGEFRFIDERTSPYNDSSDGTLLNPDSCSECSRIIEMTTEKGSNNDTQEVLHDTLNQLCQGLPTKEQDHCKSLVETQLPKTAQLKPHEVCKLLGHCAVNSEPEAVPPAQVIPGPSTPAFSPDPSTQFSPQCTLCLFLMRKMEDMLPKNRTEEAIVKLLGQVCVLLPGSYTVKCNDFIDKYGKQIVDFLLSSAAPHTICALLHLCLLEEAPGVEMLPPSSDCESCRHLAVLSGLHPSLNSSRASQTSAFLGSICLHHPNAIPKCELFLKHFGSRLQRVFGNQLDASDPCERADLCAAVRDLASARTHHCNLGPTYWCQDVAAALMCGNLAYCRRHMWK